VYNQRSPVDKFLDVECTNEWSGVFAGIMASDSIQHHVGLVSGYIACQSRPVCNNSLHSLQAPQLTRGEHIAPRGLSTSRKIIWACVQGTLDIVEIELNARDKLVKSISNRRNKSVCPLLRYLPMRRHQYDQTKKRRSNIYLG
jgi:hypothetical protein